MPLVSIPNVGDVEFPDSLSTEEIHKHSGRLHKIADISTRTGSVNVTRSLPFAKKAIAKGSTHPALTHFVSQTEKLADGRDHVDFATGRHALKATEGAGKNFEQAEFHRLLNEDLQEATSRAGTRADWLDVDQPNQSRKKTTSDKLVAALQQRAAERK